MKKLVIKTLGEFGINEIESISRIKNKNNNMWIIDDKYVVKTYNGKTDNDLRTLERILLVNTELYNAGAQIPKHYKTNIGELYAKADDEICYTLTGKMSGLTLKYYDGNYQKRAFSIGKSIAEFHLALKKLTGKIECWNGDFMGEYHDWISREIREKNIGIEQEVLDYLINVSSKNKKV